MAKQVELSVIIPARNEEKNIGHAIGGVRSALRRTGVKFEIIAIDDCSSDGTGGILDGLAGKTVTVIHRKKSPGFGNALKSGFKMANGKYIVSFMGDLSDDPEDLVRMLKKAREGYDVVIGSRFVAGGRIAGYPKAKLVANRLFNNLLALVLKVSYKDLTNAFKMYRSEVLKKMKIESSDFDITVEVPIKAIKGNAKVVEVPVSWHGRQSGSPKWKLAGAGRIYFLRLFKTAL